MRAPHPRLRALLQAVGEAPYESDEAQDVRFRLPDQSGQEQWLRLDEIPLPQSTPGRLATLRIKQHDAPGLMP